MRECTPVSHAVGSWAAPLRLLLLVAVAIGVVQMHVLGHASTDHDAHGVAPAVSHAMAGWTVSPSDMPPDDSPDPGGSTLLMDLLAVCLAILNTAGIATALLVLLVRPPTSRQARLSGPRAHRWYGRDPPVAIPPLGWRLADLSVLRI